MTCCKENKDLLEHVREGMHANLDVIKTNVEYLKSKSSSQW